MDPNSSEARDSRARLDAEKARLEGSLRDLEQAKAEDGGITLSGDSGAETTTADTREGLQNSLNDQLAEIDAALRRVDDGTYGIDEVTGEPIDAARLEAVPTARTNVSR